ncbi:MAG: hypothetical protein ACJ71C_07060 [Nitrososphaeraceae archaeon]
MLCTQMLNAAKIICLVMKSSDNNKEKTEVSDKDKDDIESKLLRQTKEEEKARRRTRGPYRKSSRSIVTTHD